MKTLWKAALLAGAAWSAASCAYAQETVITEDGASVEELVVTARRTEESLQDVPAAVSAFSEKALERLPATDTTALQGAVPNLNIVPGRGSSNAANIYIRGVGQPDALQTFDPAVGVYVDDVYLSRIRGAQFDLLDLERVEVLRGPQGTLYGKNTIGGAMKFVTRKPGQDFRANIQAAVGNYEQMEVKGAMSGPLTDIISAGVAGLRSTRDGYVTNPVTGQKYNDKDTMALRGAVAVVPNDRFRADFTADWSKDDAALNVGQPTSTLTTLFGAPLVPVTNPPPAYNFEGRTTPGLPNSTRLESWGVAAHLAFELTDAITVKSITAHRRLNTDDYVDIDASQVETGDVLVAVDQDQTSQEFQAAYVQGPWNVVGGVYFLRENITSHQEAYADDVLGAPYAFSGFLRTVDDDLETTSYAAYANASYAITEALRLSGGIRYTKEEKDYFRTTSTFFSLFPFANATYNFEPPVGDWEDVSPMVSVDWQATDDIMVYAKASKGFKSGGFNGRANSPGESSKYDPEEVVSYEAGVKSSWMDNRVRANLAVFKSDYKDFQARVSGIENDPVTGIPSPTLSVLNAGKLDIQGAELEVTATPIQHLLLEAQVGYLDAEYGEFDDIRFTNFGGSRAFQTPAFSPEWTMRYAGQYEFQLGDMGYLTTGAAARFRSEMALAIDNTPVNSDVKLPGMFSEDYWLYDARIVWEDASRRITAGLYGQNLSDEAYRTDAQEFSSVGNIRTVYYGAPRTYTFRVGYRF
jgi:iron complex outermembrane receptor protein